MIKDLNNTELKKLNKIKNFMNTPDYKKQKEKYLSTKEILTNALEKFFEPLSNYETKQINILKSKYKELSSIN